MSALLNSPDDWIKTRQWFALVKSGVIVLQLSWLIAYTRGRDLKRRDDAQEASGEVKLARASSTSRHGGGVKMAASNVLAEQRSAATKIHGTH